jgi:bifunctional non-homologous end joining protein LigD
MFFRHAFIGGGLDRANGKCRGWDSTMMVRRREEMPKVPFRVSPMLATQVDKPFARDHWIFEEKYDGVRILAYKEGSDVSLISRNAIDRTSRYPEIAAAVRKLRAETLALDGEIVVFDSQKISRFQLLQQGRGRPQYVVFDCLYRNGQDLRSKPLSVRRTALERSVKPSDSLLWSAQLARDGERAFRMASRRGLEGIIAKNFASRYVEGRSSEWLKVKAHREEEFVIGGFTQPSGARSHFGALLLGAYAHGDHLQYVGKVGTGFDERTLGALHRMLQERVQAKSPFASDPRERGATYVRPELVAQISYVEWTAEGRLRHPVYLGLRDDKNAKAVVWQNTRT